MAQPIKVWITPSGPNPWKVVQLMDELAVPYDLQVIRFEQTKTKMYLDVCPNGRVPAIEDPNTGVTVWESGAIILYLIENYNPKRLLTFDTVKEKALCNQWLAFQLSGQGPYFGQLGWFSLFHQEKIPSAVERYRNEVARLLGVLETALKGKEWLVGDKMTYADLSFVWWNEVIKQTVQDGADPLQDFPAVLAWHRRMTALPSFKKSEAMRTAYMAEQGLIATGLPEGVSVQDLLDKAEKMRTEDAAAK